jgi:hypothetical protein
MTQVEVNAGAESFNSQQTLQLCAVLCALSQPTRKNMAVWKESSLTRAREFESQNFEAPLGAVYHAKTSVFQGCSGSICQNSHA